MSAAKKAGVIYILTNPSFPDYVKIGYATNIENRLKQLNRSECIPFAFRVWLNRTTIRKRGPKRPSLFIFRILGCAGISQW